jgi:4-nitrophenyl phosphatase
LNINSIEPFPEAAILDMDGVLWRSNQPLCDLPLLFRKFQENNIKAALASNNATSSIQQFLEKLLTFGVILEPWQIVSAAMATSYLLKQEFPDGGPIHILGSDSLKLTLQESGFFHSDENPIAVVVGMDRELTYQKMDNASRWVRKGLPFFGTNPDLTYPTPDGLAPGAGACIAAVEAASGQKAVMAGKPNPYLFTVAMQRMGTSPGKTLVIGDRLETDILGGQRAGCKTLLVLSGVAQKTDLQSWSPQPDLVLDNIMDLFNH